MHIPIRRIGLDAISSLSLRSFRCTPGVGDAPAVEAAIRGLTADELQEDGSVLFAALDGHLTVGVSVVTPIAVRPGTWYIPVLAPLGESRSVGQQQAGCDLGAFNPRCSVSRIAGVAGHTVLGQQATVLRNALKQELHLVSQATPVLDDQLLEAVGHVGHKE